MSKPFLIYHFQLVHLHIFTWQSSYFFIRRIKGSGSGMNDLYTLRYEICSTFWLLRAPDAKAAIARSRRQGSYTKQSDNPAIRLIMFAASVREVNMSVPASKNAARKHRQTCLPAMRSASRTPNASATTECKETTQPSV